jgi:hypothetical protein
MEITKLLSEEVYLALKKLPRGAMKRCAKGLRSDNKYKTGCSTVWLSDVLRGKKECDELVQAAADWVLEKCREAEGKAARRRWLQGELSGIPLTPKWGIKPSPTLSLPEGEGNRSGYGVDSRPALEWENKKPVIEEYICQNCGHCMEIERPPNPQRGDKTNP